MTRWAYGRHSTPAVHGALSRGDALNSSGDARKMQLTKGSEPLRAAYENERYAHHPNVWEETPSGGSAHGGFRFWLTLYRLGEITSCSDIHLQSSGSSSSRSHHGPSSDWQPIEASSDWRAGQCYSPLPLLVGRSITSRAGVPQVRERKSACVWVRRLPPATRGGRSGFKRKLQARHLHGLGDGVVQRHKCGLIGGRDRRIHVDARLRA